MNVSQGREKIHSSRLLRFARWLQSRSFALTPEQVGVVEGLRAATAVAPVVALSLLLQERLLTWAALAAFWTCLADPGGPRLGRLRAMGVFALVGTLLAGFLSAIAILGPLLVAPVLFVVTALCGLIRVYGAAGAQVGVLSAVVAVVAVGFPNAPAEALWLCGAFLMGSGWAVLLCIVIWPIHPLMPARRAVSAIFRELYDMATYLSARAPAGAVVELHRETQGAEHRRAVRMAIERARSMVLRFAVGRGNESFRGRLNRAIEAGDRIFAGLIALDHDLDVKRDMSKAESEREALRGIGGAMVLVGSQLSRTNPDYTVIAAQGDAIARLAKTDNDLLLRIAKGSAQALSNLASAETDLSDGAAPEPKDPQARDLSRRPILLRDTSVFRHALRLAFAVAGVYLVTVYFGLHYAYWATMATIVVMQPQTSTTWPRTVERMIGSAVGGLAAALLVVVFNNPLELLVVIFPLAAAAIAFRSVNYTLFVMFLTPLFVIMVEMFSADGSTAVAWDRAINNVLGSLAGLAGCLLLWPDAERKAFRVSLAEAVEANIKYAAVVVGCAHYADIDAARQAAGIASSSAEVERQRMVLEGRRKRARLDEAGAVLASLREVAGAATLAWLISVPSQDCDFKARANRYERLAAELGAEIKGLSSGETERQLSLDEPLDDIGRAVAKSTEKVRLYEDAVAAGPRQEKPSKTSN